ncbi:MAG: hypothetical protein ACRCWO_09780, partial [Bosea sp. (in: a-proteobacteria)]
MNPSKILPRDMKPATPAARKPQLSRADFSLPADDTRGADAARARRDEQIRRMEITKDERADAREAARNRDTRPDTRANDTRGSERSRQVRQDERVNEHANDRTNPGEASDHRSARADAVSNRDKTKHADKDRGDTAATEANPDKSLSAEEAARLALAEARPDDAVKIETTDGQPADAATGEGKVDDGKSEAASTSAEAQLAEVALGLPQH